MKVPRIKRAPSTWIEVLQPYLRRYRLAHLVGSSVVTNAEGCKGMYELLLMMGDRLEYTRQLERAVILAQDKRGFLEAKNIIYERMQKEKEKIALDNLS